MKDLKVAFINFGSNNFSDNYTRPLVKYYLKILKEKYNVIYDENNQIKDIDILFSGVGLAEPENSYKYKKLIIHVGNELRVPKGHYDLAVSILHKDDDRHVRWTGAYDAVENSLCHDRIFNKKVEQPRESFCMFMSANPVGIVRNELFVRLNQYKPVISPGAIFHNKDYDINKGRKPGWQQVKMDILDMEKPKFMIACENYGFPGYVSEKIVNAMAAGCIPIYWGSEAIGLDFNTKSIVNVHEYGTISGAINRVVEIDNSDDLYQEIISEPWLLPHQKEQYNKDRVKEKVINIAESIV